MSRHPILGTLVLVLALSGAGQMTSSVRAEPPAPGAPTVRVRKSVPALTPAERHQFVDAVLKLKATPSPYDADLSYYDQFVAWHVALAECDRLDPLASHRQMAHAGPMFLPWHREYLLLFEDALRAVSGADITVPYWDWTDHGSVASVFADDFMGGDGNPREGYAVTTGPFRKGKWRLAVMNRGVVWGLSNSRHITRRLGAPSDLPTRAEVARTLAAPHYDVAPYDETSDPGASFRNALEGFRPPTPSVSLTNCVPDGTMLANPLGDLVLHNAVHLWVGGWMLPENTPPRGGTMSIPVASPNDPVFFLHHANIDRLWAHWQSEHGIDTYTPERGVALNNRGDVMRPFDESGIIATPASVADVARLGYRYDDAPTTGYACTIRATA
jgi:tyrosinase